MIDRIAELIAELQRRYEEGEELRRQIDGQLGILLVLDRKLRDTGRHQPILATVFRTAREHRDAHPAQVIELLEATHAFIATIAPDVVSRPRS